MKPYYVLIAVAASIAAIAISQKQAADQDGTGVQKADVEDVDSEMEAWFI